MRHNKNVRRQNVHYHDSFEIFHVPEAWSLDIEKLIDKFADKKSKDQQI